MNKIRTCTFPNCKNKHHAKDLCGKHYKAKFKLHRFRQNYRKTINGFLSKTYTKMQARIRGKAEKAYLWKGLQIIDRKTFYLWSKNSKDFLRIYKEWVMSNYNMKLIPSVNRINSKKGYILNNIQWVTHSQNSSLASVSKKLNVQEKQVVYKVLGVNI